MSVATKQEILRWIGRDVYDPYGKRLGPLGDVLVDGHTGAPAWLTLTLEDCDPAGRAVPAAEAQEAGRAIRVPQTAEAVRGAPAVPAAGPLDDELAAALARHYGLGASSSAEPPPEPPSPDPGRVQEIVAALRDAHAMEQAVLKRLAAMIWALEDEELIHDLERHHQETNEHAELLRRRLGELGSHRSSWVDLQGKLPAWLKSQAERFRHHTEIPAVQDAVAAERMEVKAYLHLERLAEGAGDGRTAELARAIRADEEAMLFTLGAGCVRHREVHLQEDGRNPFAAPKELSETAPRT